jgi:spermidine synthase
LPNYFHHKYNAGQGGASGVQQIAVDIDEELLHIARDWFDLPRAPHLKFRGGDALEVVQTMRENAFNIIIRDVFADFITPVHLIGDAFYAEITRTLAPGGLYLANNVSSSRGDAVSAEAKIASKWLENVQILPAEPISNAAKKKGAVTNFIVVGNKARA